MYQLTVRQEGGAEIIQRLREHTRERTANKAIWRAARLFPARVEELERTRLELRRTQAELARLREIITDYVEARAALGDAIIGPGGSEPDG